MDQLAFSASPACASSHDPQLPALADSQGSKKRSPFPLQLKLILKFHKELEVRKGRMVVHTFLYFHHFAHLLLPCEMSLLVFPLNHLDTQSMDLVPLTGS